MLDFAAGCGLAAIAAAHVGAASVDASEIDPVATAAIALNARMNGARVTPICEDVVLAASRWDLILAGDVCYAAPMTARILPWLRVAAAGGAEVWIADPGRAYLPREDLRAFGPVYNVPVTRELEDRDHRPTRLYRLGRQHPAPGPALASSRRHPTGTPE